MTAVGADACRMTSDRCCICRLYLGGTLNPRVPPRIAAGPCPGRSFFPLSLCRKAVASSGLLAQPVAVSNGMMPAHLSDGMILLAGGLAEEPDLPIGRRVGLGALDELRVLGHFHGVNPNSICGERHRVLRSLAFRYSFPLLAPHQERPGRNVNCLGLKGLAFDLGASFRRKRFPDLSASQRGEQDRHPPIRSSAHCASCHGHCAVDVPVAAQLPKQDRQEGRGSLHHEVALHRDHSRDACFCKLRSESSERAVILGRRLALSATGALA